MQSTSGISRVVARSSSSLSTATKTLRPSSWHHHHNGHRKQHSFPKQQILKRSTKANTSQPRMLLPSPSFSTSSLTSLPELVMDSMATESKDAAPLGAVQPLQALYERLRPIEGRLNEIMQDPRGSVELRDAMTLMNQVTLEDLGLSTEYFLEMARSNNSCYTSSHSMTIIETPTFDIAAFIMCKGFVLPLHDHPNMVVCSKLVHGKVRIRSFSRMGPTIEDGSFKAKLEFDTRKVPTDPSWMLTPTEGNFHQICAMEDSVMLDVLLPPYQDHDRPCKFYHSRRDGLGSYYLSLIEKPYTLQRLRLPINVPYEGYQPSQTS